MRVGIVCEGSTDYITISAFATESLRARGVEADFIDLHPGLDKTSEVNSGWSNALLWLEKNSLKVRKNNILGGGLFGGSLSWKKCDVILVQLDCDCFDDIGFVNFLKKRNIAIGPIQTWQERVVALNAALLQLSQLRSEELKQERHILSCASHNSESWCIAALPDDAERMVEEINLQDTGIILLTEISSFSSAGKIAEHRRLKDRVLREIFCQTHKKKTNRIEARSSTYKKLIDDTHAFETQ